MMLLMPLSGHFHDGEVDLLSEVLTSRIKRFSNSPKPNLALRIGRIKLNFSVWLLNLLPLLGLSLHSGALLSRKTNRVFGGFRSLLPTLLYEFWI